MNSLTDTLAAAILDEQHRRENIQWTAEEVHGSTPAEVADAYARGLLADVLSEQAGPVQMIHERGKPAPAVVDLPAEPSTQRPSGDVDQGARVDPPTQTGQLTTAQIAEMRRTGNGRELVEAYEAGRCDSAMEGRA